MYTDIYKHRYMYLSTRSIHTFLLSENRTASNHRTASKITTQSDVITRQLCSDQYSAMW